MVQASSNAATLRAKLNVGRPAVAMAAHNPLAAKLAADAGFDAIWGSGFELSASYAVPVIADLDTGFGNAVPGAAATIFAFSSEIS